MLIEEVYPKIVENTDKFLLSQEFKIFKRLNDRMGTIFFSQFNALTVGIKLSKYPVLYFTLKRREFEYNLDEFDNINQMNSLIQHFFLGKYSFHTDTADVLSDIEWSDSSLKIYNKRFSDNFVNRSEGLSWV